jgi:dolichyl-phosphate beta-glucosyltransferase
MSDEPHLSIVVPAYNEVARIGPTLDRVLAYMRSRGTPFEVLVVDDGSSDGTAAAVERRDDSELRVIRLASNQGKGAAVRWGVGESRGELILVTDADLSVPIEDLERLESFEQQGYTVVCGSRALSESSVLVHQPFYREQMGKIFNLIIHLLGLSSFRDTQCGFKLLRAREAREIFARSRIRRFAFDVELLFLAGQLGFRSIEVPVSWRHVPESRVHVVWDSARMLWDVLVLRLRTFRPIDRRTGDT